MKPNTQQHPLEARMLKIRGGFGAVEDKATLFSFTEGKFLPEEVSTRLQRGIDAFSKERQAEAELTLAIAERKRLMPHLSSFCDEALVVAKRHYGGDEVRMASFGVEKCSSAKAKPRRAKPKGCRAGATQHPQMLGPACGGANVVEEVVTTIVEEVVLSAEEGSCGVTTPRCSSKRSRAGK